MLCFFDLLRLQIRRIGITLLFLLLLLLHRSCAHFDKTLADRRYGDIWTTSNSTDSRPSHTDRSAASAPISFLSLACRYPSMVNSIIKVIYISPGKDLLCVVPYIQKSHRYWLDLENIKISFEYRYVYLPLSGAFILSWGCKSMRVTS